MTEVGPRLSRTALLVALFALVVGGCASAGAGQQARLLRVDDPLKEPVWVPSNEALLALSEDGRRVERVDLGDLEVMASRNLGEKIEGVTSDALYVYAGTQDRLVVMRRETLGTVETVDLEGMFRHNGLHPTGVSGIATGESAGGVYLTLGGEPFVISIRKP